MSARILRKFSPCGPCLTFVDGAGPIVRETGKSWITQQPGKPERQVRKATFGYHAEPCPSCRDHARSQYPDGLWD